MSLRALRHLGVLRHDAELLGIGVGAEATLFWLTRHVRRVFATDLYIDNEDWATQTPPGMLRVSRETRNVVIGFDEAAADLRAGRDWSRYPHVVLMHQGLAVTWSSVHVALRKLR